VLGGKHIDASSENNFAHLSRISSLDVRLPDPKGLERDGLTLAKYLSSVPAHTDMPVLLFTGVEAQPYAEAIDELTVPADSRPSLHTCRQTAHAQYLR
jgi:hypothetical protein